MAIVRTSGDNADIYVGKEKGYDVYGYASRRAPQNSPLRTSGSCYRLGYKPSVSLSERLEAVEAAQRREPQQEVPTLTPSYTTTGYTPIPKAQHVPSTPALAPPAPGPTPPPPPTFEQPLSSADFFVSKPIGT